MSSQISQFYAPFSSTCFVVLGLWLVVIQQRYKEWKGDPHMIRRAFGIGLYFSLPGIMTLISLVNPAEPELWETSYALVALGGAVVMAVLYTAADDRLAATAYLAALALYVAIGVIAVIGFTRHNAQLENQVDQVLLCVMLFLGVNVAWLLLFGPAHRTATARGGRPRPGGRHHGRDRRLTAAAD
jgi:uncharacterized membrane protein SirB2